MNNTESLEKSLERILREGESSLRESIYSKSLYAYDGAFPRYINQSKKVLVIGREAYGDYSYYRQNNLDEQCVSINDCHLAEYNNNRLFIGGREASFTENCLTSRSVKYHARIIALAYAIITGDWSISAKEIKNIANSIGRPEGISFAYANFSKLLNTTDVFSISESENANRIRFWAVLDNNLHILQREIELLDPDVIITQAFIEMCGKINYNCFNNLGKTDRSNLDKRGRNAIKTMYYPAIEYTLFLSSGKTVPILDVPHFSGIQSQAAWKNLWSSLKRYFECMT